MIEIHSMLPDLFLRRLEEKDEEGILRSIDSARVMGDGARHLMAGMRRFGGLHEARDGEIEATVLIDTVADLVPTLGGDQCWDLILAAVSYLVCLPTSTPRIELFDLPAGERPPEFMPIAALEDSLAKGDLVETCGTVGRLVRAVHSREYFLEIVLEAVAPESTPTGRLLVLADASVKGLHSTEWEAGRGIAYRLFKALSDNPLMPASSAVDAPPPTPCRAGFVASLEMEEPEATWLYLSHAFQAERYAQMRPRAIRLGLRRWIAERLFDGDAAAMDAAEAAMGERPQRPPGAVTEELPEGVASRIIEQISLGQVDVAAEAAELATSLADVEPLYNAIARGAVVSLAHGDPWPLLAVNAARWGAHLLGPPGAGLLTQRLVERLAAIREMD